MDLSAQDEHELFALPDLLQRSNFLHDVHQFEGSLFNPVEFDVPNIKLDNPYAPLTQLATSLKLPDLETFQYGPLATFDEIPEPSAASLSDENEFPSLSIPALDLQPEEDIWKIASDLGPLSNDAKLLTWEAFEHPGQEEQKIACLSEAGPAVFDAALQARADRNNTPAAAGSIIRSDALLRCLCELGLGRASMLFIHDAETATFKQAIENGRMSGYSVESSQSLVNDFLNLGGSMVNLKDYVRRVYASDVAHSDSVALANAVSTALDAIEAHVVQNNRHIGNLLQLQTLFRGPMAVVQTLERVVQVATEARESDCFTSILFELAEEAESSCSPDQAILKQIWTKVSTPWLASFRTSLGFHSTTGLRDVDDLETTPIPLPRFFDEELQTTIAETRKCAGYMKEHNPDHPLASLQSFAAEQPPFEWAFSVDDLNRIERKAENCHTRLAAAVQQFETGLSLLPMETHPPRDISAPPDDRLHDYDHELMISTKLFDEKPSFQRHDNEDDLYHAVMRRLSSPSTLSADDALAIPLSAVAKLSLQPLISAQHVLLTRATSRSMLVDFSLRKHFDIHRAFYLCGSGLFTSRLSSVLFSPDAASAERHRGAVRGGTAMGLRLGSGKRRDWPPADSELKLALMGILVDCWQDSHPPTGDEARNARKFAELPGGLSFALRTSLSQDEIDRISDQNTIYALDFLKLSYTPPAALAIFFTDSCLDKYDRIFKLFLRMSRMQFVVGQLFRDTMNRPRSAGAMSNDHVLRQRFRTLANHFILTLCSHFVTSGVAGPWQKFQSYLDGVENQLCTSDRGFAPSFSVSDIVRMHESTLDAITSALLLKKKQSKAMNLFEQLCNDILEFAKRVKRVEDDVNVGDDFDETKNLYTALTQRLRDFISLLRELNGKAGVGEAAGHANEKPFEDLAAQLEGGFWSSV